MQGNIRSQRQARPRRASRLAIATLVSGIVLAACGGSSSTPALTSTVSSAIAASTATTRVPSIRADPPPALSFSECMRANDVPNFPDPQPSGAILIHPGPGGIDPLSPAFNAAWVKCEKLDPLPGMPAPGKGTHPSAEALAHALEVARCMRNRGISRFPDPRSSVPANASPAIYAYIADNNGAIIAMPSSDVTNQTGPAYYRAADACGFH
jgi:hypothetical protein